MSLTRTPHSCFASGLLSTLWCWCSVPDETGHLHEVPTEVGKHGCLHLRTADLLSHTQVGQTVAGAEFTCQGWQAPGEKGLSQEVAGDLQSWTKGWQEVQGVKGKLTEGVKQGYLRNEPGCVLPTPPPGLQTCRRRWTAGDCRGHRRTHGPAGWSSVKSLSCQTVTELGSNRCSPTVLLSSP